METRRSCTRPERCPFYSYQLLRCEKGFINPKAIKESVSACLKGALSPCPHTIHGQKVIKVVREHLTR